MRFLSASRQDPRLIYPKAPINSSAELAIFSNLDQGSIYRRCFETSLVISNILTWLLPLNTGLSESSALIMVRFFLSWQPFLLMYFQSFLVSSERGSGSDPTMAASLSSGWTGLMKAGFSLRLA